MSPPIAVRFAPSPTGYLHVGNARIALMNWLFARKHQGRFILRFDDTDKSRSTDTYADAIRKDLAWMGIDWQQEFSQHDRMAIYKKSIQFLKDSDRLYPCFETPEELSLQRKLQASQGLPPVYDNTTALKREKKDIERLQAEGKKPHWRFRLFPEQVAWTDLARGPVCFEALKASDPVLIREDGCPLYTLTSVIDDIDMDITHVVRGEDHVVNTAVQTQIFEALASRPPQFSHISLLLDTDGKPLSKRIDSLSLRKLQEQAIFPKALLGYLAHLGTNTAAHFSESLESIIDDFHFGKFGRAAPCFDAHALANLNRNILQNMSYEQARSLLPSSADENFWQTISHNIDSIHDVDIWLSVLTGTISSENYSPETTADRDYLQKALALLPQEGWEDQSDGSHIWSLWQDRLKSGCERKGKALLLPIRLALTGLGKGPELSALLAYLGYERVKLRLSKAIQDFGS